MFKHENILRLFNRTEKDALLMKSWLRQTRAHLKDRTHAHRNWIIDLGEFSITSEWFQFVVSAMLLNKDVLSNELVACWDPHQLHLVLMKEDIFEIDEDGGKVSIPPPTPT